VRIFVIPGNHDANWSLINKSDDIQIRKELKSDLAVSKHLLDSGKEYDRQAGSLRLKHYYEFSDNCMKFGQSARNHEYFYTTTFEHQNVTVGVSGLNSAWRSTRKDQLPEHELTTDPDLGHLVLGKHQLKAAVEDMQKCDIRVALVHHPPMDSWFADFDKQSQINHLTAFDYVLRGHEHVYTGSVISRIGASNATLLFAAGALYQVDPYPKLFSATVIELDQHMQTAFKWKYDADAETWNAIVEPGSRQPGLRSSLATQVINRLKSGVGA
jgi:hypothetical protein